MKNNLTEARFQFLAGVINENEFKQLNENEGNEFLPMALGGDDFPDNDYLWDNIEKNIENNKEEIMSKLGITSDEEFKVFLEVYNGAIYDAGAPGDWYNFDKDDFIADMKHLKDELDVEGWKKNWKTYFS